MQVCDKVEVAKHDVFPMFWGSDESKNRLAKQAGA